MNFRRKVLPKRFTDAAAMCFLLIIIPLVYYFEVFIVLRNFYGLWTPLFVFHFSVGTYILWNIVSNLISVIFCDTSITGRLFQNTTGKDWNFCAACESITPPRSWHCNVCNICILKRDHHCIFTSCCIGYENQRYFLMFLLYIFIATVYASFYNIFFIYNIIIWDTITIIKVIFPLAALFVNMSLSQYYLFLVLLVKISCFFTGVFLYYHIQLMLRGAVTHERKNVTKLYDRGWLQNIRDCLGDRWYLVWISPFLESKLPGDGIKWNNSLKCK